MEKIKIEYSGTISLVTTKSKPYWHKTKGYYRGDKWVKARRVKRLKRVPLKKPYLYGDIILKAYTELNVGNVYADEHGRVYYCVSVSNSISELFACNLDLGKSFSQPTMLTLISSPYAESSRL